MKKILFITTNYLPSKLTGSEEFIRQISQFLSSYYEVTVVTHLGENFNYWWNPFTKRLSNTEIINNVRIIRLKNNHFKNFFISIVKVLFKFIDINLLKKIFGDELVNYFKLYLGPQFLGLKKFLKNNKFQVIHVGPMPYEYLIYVKNIHSKLKLDSKLVSTPFFHEEQDVYYTKSFKEFLNYCDKIHSVTNTERLNLIKIFSLDQEIVSVIPLFLSLNQFSNNKHLVSEAQKFKSENNLKDKVIILGLNQGGKEKKGIEYTIDALNTLSKSINNLCLITVGTKNIKDKYQINKNIKIIEVGYVYGREKDIIFESCDIFSMPSQAESFGLMYLEAWLRKKPIIAFELEPLKEVLSGGALLSKVRNREDLTNNLRTLIIAKKMRYELGNFGYNKLIKNYSSNVVLKEYKKFFDFECFS